MPHAERISSGQGMLEWLGAIFGVVGAGLLAFNVPYSGFGFVAFLLSNIFWIRYGLNTRSFGILTMQLFFTATSLLGIYRWLVLS